MDSNDSVIPLNGLLVSYNNSHIDCILSSELKSVPMIITRVSSVFLGISDLVSFLSLSISFLNCSSLYENPSVRDVDYN